MRFEALNGLVQARKMEHKKSHPLSYRLLGELCRNVNCLAIEVQDQKLCLPEVGLPFLDSSNFTLTSDKFSKTFYFGGGCQMTYSKFYS